MKPQFSIITINLNNIAGLQKTMQSVFEQTFTDYEFIVIDGGSIDGSKELIEQNKEKIGLWVSEPDNGIYNAMNKGVAHAYGEYLYFLNSGDYFYNKDVLKDFFSFNPTQDLIYGKIVFKSETDERIGIHPDRIRLSHLYYSFICHQAIFFRRTLFEKIGSYDENYKLLADWAFMTMAITKYHATYKYFENIIVAYYDTSGISSNANAEIIMKDDKNKFFREHFDFIIEDYDEFLKLKRKFKMFKSHPRIFALFKFLLNLRR